MANEVSGVGTWPMSITSQPAATSPRMAASLNGSELGRTSRPMTICLRPVRRCM